MKFSYTRISVQSISVFLSGFENLFLAKTVKVSIIKGVSKHSWDGSTELRFYIKKKLNIQKSQRIFRELFCTLRILACENVFV